MATQGNGSGDLPKTSEKSDHGDTLKSPSPPSEASEKVKKSAWDSIRDSGWVRAKYANYSPANIREIKDVETLRWICNEYRFPGEQWWNTVEEHYCGLIYMCAWARLHNIDECKDCLKDCDVCKKMISGEVRTSNTRVVRESEHEDEDEDEEDEMESESGDEMETAV